MVTEAFHLLAETTDRRILKEIALVPNRWFVRGSESDLYHALVNLALNAVQAIEAKGVTAADVVRIDAARYEAEPADRYGLAPGEYVHVRLADTGTGMSAEVKKRAFNPLFSTKEKGKRKGQGLGLTMVYNTIVAQHRGAIDVESEEGRGTVFHLYLPAGRGVPMQAEAPAQPTAPGSGTVLVVEDEEQVVGLACRVLERAGYRVLVAGDGLTAIEMFTRNAGDISVVLLDQTLPKMSGAEVMAHILRANPAMPIIISSGNRVPLPPSMPATVRLLPKPYSPADLTSAVQAALP